MSSSQNSHTGASPVDAAAHLQQRQADGAACLAAAVRYRNELGWSVLAVCPPDHVGVGKTHAKDCSSPGKAPWGAWKQYQDVAATEAELRQRWRDNPTLNVGLALGPVSGLIRVDVDGLAGDARLFVVSGGVIPPTVEFTSGRANGGRGLLYRIPPGVRLRTTVDRPGGAKEELRFQSRGAQTVLPPSRHPGGDLYAWATGRSPWEIEIAEAPPWLVDQLRDDRPAGAAGAANGAANGAPLPAGASIPEGQRDTTLTSLAGTMRRRGMSREAIEAALLVMNEQQCEPPLDDAQVRKIAASVARYSPATAQPKLKNGWGAQPAAQGGGPPSSAPPPPPTPPPPPPSAPSPPPSPSAAPPPAPPPRDPTCAYSIILKHFQDAYRPLFRRGDQVYADALGRLVRRSEACYAPGIALVDLLLNASDALDDENKPLTGNDIPGFFRRWAPVAWVDVLAGLPDEENASEISKPAAEEFITHLSAALHQLETLRYKVRVNKVEEERIERRSMFGFCWLFAKSKWEEIRSFKIWCMRDANNALCIALRVEALGQLNRRYFDGMKAYRFNQLCENYGVGRRGKINGERVMILERAFIDDQVDPTIIRTVATPPTVAPTPAGGANVTP